MNETYHPQGYFDAAALLMFVGIVFAIVLIAIISQWKIYNKAGQPGWASIVPIYNMVVLFRIVGKPAWWILMMFVPGVNLVFGIWAINMLSKSFGKSDAFTLGLLFLPFIFYPILAFGNAKYQGPFGNAVAFAEYQNAHKFEFEKHL